MVCRRPTGLPSAASRPVQSRPLSGFALDYATLLVGASPLNDASTAHGEEAASTLTLLPKQREREQAGGCQLLRFATLLTRPDGNLDSRSSGIRPCRDHASPSINSTSERPVGRWSLWISPACGYRCAEKTQPGPGSPVTAYVRPRVTSASWRSMSRRASRSAMSRRLSCSCLPLARASSSLARPRSVM
jgi:hypothetical protein